MTYCVAARLRDGLVFLADSRTNAGVDQISVFRKLSVFERPGERVMVLMTSGNLAVSQAIVNQLSTVDSDDPASIWCTRNMFEAARLVGDAVRQVHRRDAEALHEQGVEFNVNLIFGGQIKGERCRLFQLYSAGNFIEAHDECPYFQIGEAKYGKPIMDRVLLPETTLDEAAKCALISMDSTLRSNISVGLPLDLLVYDNNALRVSRFANIDEHNEYFRMIRGSWGERLRQVFAEIEDPVWTDPCNPDSLVPPGRVHQPVRILPGNPEPCGLAPLQSLAEGPDTPQQE
ncbi:MULTISPECIES: proteasome-type protease [unclassified Achromobacter]|uniref:proteasome-type protease n=1 Tax=unclassified Achromobacter TaxID=2626865 RepID=UPI000B518B0C|nr:MULTISPECIES: proteasome-type protease [unclassified Achromobacter]OWT74902.1 peptidase [Achromobacter sp. HZ28]OWT76510.1 peptidase [Achromobacter sp. HZ34]